jgi:hypothetical protein
MTQLSKICDFSFTMTISALSISTAVDWVRLKTKKRENKYGDPD